MATVNITCSTNITLTASYSNVSDTASVTYASYLFYDNCTSDRSSEYANASLQTSSNTSYLTMSYNNNGYYKIQATSNEGNHYAKWISSVTGEDNLKFSAEVMTNSFNGSNRFGIVVGTSDYKSERYQITGTNIEHQTFVGTSETLLDSHSISSAQTNTWYKMEFIVQGTSFTFTLSDMNENELYTVTSTFQSNVITSSSTKQYGLYYLNYYPTGEKNFRNIKVESL